jgi:peptidoglycan/LPS O-acetylase OafA/YrhL
LRTYEGSLVISKTRSHPFPDQLDTLTGIRFFLAVGVVLFHYQLDWAYPHENAGFIGRARLSVDIFFILSGFILAHVYLQGDKPPSIKKFIIARFARIYPVHLAILLGLVVLYLGAGLIGVQLDASHFNATDFFRTLFLVQAWFPTQVLNNWNGPSWSLSAEWFVYLMFPAYAWLALKWRERPLILVALSVGAFLLIDYLYRGAYGIVLPNAEDNMGILRIIPEFLLGIGLYFFGQKIDLSKQQAVISALVISGMLLLAMQAAVDDRLIVALAGPFILSLALLAKSGQATFLSKPLMLFGGEASFALYLVHLPIFMVWRNMMEKLFDLPGDYKMGLGELAILLALSLAVAAALHVLVERPGRDFIRAKFKG